jgi:UDP-N-acetylmuramate--alanine ligase
MLILVDTQRSQLRVYDNGILRLECPISCAANGLGCREGSGCTPWGWHRVAAVIGHDAPYGARFVSREFTGEIWNGQPLDEDWILSRILRLEGLEDGVNRGPGIDSFERYIYIHGTPREDLLGSPASHGCVRVSNDHAIALANLVPEHSLVFISPRGTL